MRHLALATRSVSIVPRRKKYSGDPEDFSPIVSSVLYTDTTCRRRVAYRLSPDMSDFSDTWNVTWEVLKTIPRAKSCVLEETGKTFKSGRPIVDCVFFDSARPENTPTPVQQNEAFVKAGEALQHSQVISQKGEMQRKQLEKKLAWQQGALIFKGETLEQVVIEVRRYTDKKIRIVDADIKNTKVGGYYKTDDIDSLLRSMSQSFGIHVAYLDDDVIQLSSK